MGHFYNHILMLERTLLSNHCLLYWFSSHGVKIYGKLEKTKEENIASALLIIFICIYILITLYSMQKPEIISHSEEVYWGDLGSASPITALYGLSRTVVRSGKSCTCNLTVRWYLNGELVAERRTTFLYMLHKRDT